MTKKVDEKVDVQAEETVKTPAKSKETPKKAKAGTKATAKKTTAKGSAKPSTAKKTASKKAPAKSKATKANTKAEAEKAPEATPEPAEPIKKKNLTLLLPEDTMAALARIAGNKNTSKSNVIAMLIEAEDKKGEEAQREAFKIFREEAVKEAKADLIEAIKQAKV